MSDTAATTTTAPAASAARQAKFTDTSVINFGKNAEGKPYDGSENNPKREGSGAHGRFQLYRDGMTIKEALDAGLSRADINYDSDKGFIVVS